MANSPLTPRAASARGRFLCAVALAALVLLPAEQAAAAPPVATAPAAPAAATAKGDPFEKANRGMYSLSEALDRAITGPITHGYMAVIPAVVRNGISTFLANLSEPRTAINDVLQGRPVPAGKAVTRLVVNTTVGLAGIIDVAKHIGVPRSEADFGQTLGRYGVRAGPYVFVPFMGPTDVRDAVGSLVDTFSDPFAWVTGGLGARFVVARSGVGALDMRAQADSEMHALDDAIDPYATIRSAYLQTREAAVDQARGQAPSLPDFDDPAGASQTASASETASASGTANSASPTAQP